MPDTERIVFGYGSSLVPKLHFIQEMQEAELQEEEHPRWSLGARKNETDGEKMKSINAIVLIVIVLLCNGLAYADIKQKVYEKAVSSTERLGEEVHETLELAKKLGFYVDEVRFEVSLTPKVEIFFRDKGDTGKLYSLLDDANKAQKTVLRMLQATRNFNVAHYSPTGIKLVTGIAKPNVEILSTWQP